MNRILIIGGGSSLVAALRALDHQVAVRPSEMVIHACTAEHDCWAIPPVQAEDPFNGGGRSKGEKKRAARERRMRGGY